MVMYALSRRVRLESSRPHVPQSLHAPSIAVEALVMRSKYPGMGSTDTGPASPARLAIVGCQKNGREQKRRTRMGGGGGEIILHLREQRDCWKKYSPDGVDNPPTRLLAHLKTDGTS